MDWNTVMLLAAILWFDGGVRRIGRGSVVLRRVLAGPWEISALAPDGGWRAIAQWPAAAPVLVLSEPLTRPAVPDHERRLAVVARWLTGLRLAGATGGALLVLGVPLAVGRYGAFGFLAVAVVLVLYGVIVAMIAMACAARLGLRGAALFRFAMPIVWPFNAPYVAERALSVAVRGASPLEVARLLLGDEAFSAWARPLAYDAREALAAGPVDGRREAVLVPGYALSLSEPGLDELLDRSRPQVSPGALYCPRCGHEFRPDAVECRSCNLMALVRSPVSQERQETPERRSTIVPSGTAPAKGARRAASSRRRRKKRRLR